MSRIWDRVSQKLVIKLRLFELLKSILFALCSYVLWILKEYSRSLILKQWLKQVSLVGNWLKHWGRQSVFFFPLELEIDWVAQKKIYDFLVCVDFSTLQDQFLRFLSRLGPWELHRFIQVHLWHVRAVAHRWPIMVRWLFHLMLDRKMHDCSLSFPQPELGSVVNLITKHGAGPIRL